MNLSTQPVTAVAGATSVPGRLAGYARRYTDLGNELRIDRMIPSTYVAVAYCVGALLSSWLHAARQVIGGELVGGDTWIIAFVGASAGAVVTTVSFAVASVLFLAKKVGVRSCGLALVAGVGFFVIAWPIEPQIEYIAGGWWYPLAYGLVAAAVVRGVESPRTSGSQETDGITTP